MALVARQTAGAASTLRLLASQAHESIDLLQRPLDFVCSSSVVRLLRRAESADAASAGDSSGNEGVAAVQFIGDETSSAFGCRLWVGIAESNRRGKGCTS